MIMIIILTLVGQIILSTRAGVVNLNGNNIQQAELRILEQSIDKILRQANYLKTALVNVIQSNISNGSSKFSNTITDSRSIELSSSIDKILEIQNTLTALSGNINKTLSTKMTMSRLEFESLMKQIDQQEQILVQTQNRNQLYLGNFSNDLEERFNTIEQPKHLKQLEEALRKKDCKEILKVNNRVDNDTKITEIISRVYREERDTNIILFLGVNVINITTRAAIFNTLYEEIYKLDDICTKNANLDEQFRLSVLSVSNQLKLIYVLQNYIIKIETAPPNLIQSTNNLVGEIKGTLSQIFSDSGRRKMKEIYGRFGYDYEDRISITDQKLLYHGFDKNDTNRNLNIQYKLNTTNSLNDINCWVEIHIQLINRLFTKNVLLLRNEAIMRYNRASYISEQHVAKQFEEALLIKDYDTALKIYKTINNDQIINAVIKNVGQISEGVDQLLEFTGRTSNITTRVVILTAIAEYLDQPDIAYVCDMLKLIDALENCGVQADPTIPSIIQYQKKLVTSLLKSSFEKSLYDAYHAGNLQVNFNVIQDSFNRFTINDVNSTLTLGRYEVFINKSLETGKIYCYFRGGVSIDSYDKWYTINKLKFAAPWFLFIVVITKWCSITDL